MRTAWQQVDRMWDHVSTESRLLQTPASRPLQAARQLRQQ